MVVEQADNLPFNRAKLFNVFAKRLGGFYDYYVFHDTEYRCFYVHNAHATLTMQNSVIWIQSNTTSADTTIEIGLGSSAVDGTEQTVANESTAPTGVTFSAPANQGAALSIGNVLPGEHKAVWVKRIVNVASSAYNNDNAIIS